MSGATPYSSSGKARTLPNLQKLLELYESKQLPFADVPEDGDWYTDKFVIWYDGESDLEGFQAGLTGKFDYIDRGNGFAEMVPCGCSKATGMEKMMQLLGADRSHVFAVGDSLNDRPMLEAAGTRASPWATVPCCTPMRTTSPQTLLTTAWKRRWHTST